MSALDYELPTTLIAQEPPAHREDARLLVVDRAAAALHDRTIRDLPALLDPGDLLVVNNTRVLPARFQCQRATGGRVRGLFVEDQGSGIWRVMLEGSRRLRIAERLVFKESRNNTSEPIAMELVERLADGHWLIRIDCDDSVAAILDRVGNTPLPPYIARKTGEASQAGCNDSERYQTVYASEPGAIAAPTAGLHFTNSLLNSTRERGVACADVTLHVGVGTFKPIATERIVDHIMHKEWFNLPESTAEAIYACRQRRGRVVAVGTTSLRVLESVARVAAHANGDRARTPLRASSGWTDLFVYPPYRVRAVDALLTNFHLPKSTLLALVMAFAGIDLTRKAYAHAIAGAYRFYSYGDAMLIV